ncbi:hypothetical protein GF378_03215 [Candidatus Pacearchaeota archaeon]|nr:hypothetical protein [Candidatus Pacearchaeota archaeon]
MKLEVNISKGNLFVAIAFLAIIGAIFFTHASITDSSAPNHPGDQISIASGDYIGDSVDEAINYLDERLDNLESFSAGENAVALSDSLSEITTRRSYQTIKSFTVGQSGTIRLEFQYRSSNRNYRIHIRIVKKENPDDVLWETVKWYESENWEDSGNIDLDVEAGDVFYIQGYSRDLYCPDYSDTCFGKPQVRNAKIKLSNELPQITFG